MRPRACQDELRRLAESPERAGIGCAQSCTPDLALFCPAGRRRGISARWMNRRAAPGVGSPTHTVRRALTHTVGRAVRADQCGRAADQLARSRIDPAGPAGASSDYRAWVPGSITRPTSRCGSAAGRGEPEERAPAGEPPASGRTTIPLHRAVHDKPEPQRVRATMSPHPIGLRRMASPNSRLPRVVPPHAVTTPRPQPHSAGEPWLDDDPFHVKRIAQRATAPRVGQRRVQAMMPLERHEAEPQRRPAHRGQAPNNATAFGSAAASRHPSRCPPDHSFVRRQARRSSQPSEPTRRRGEPDVPPLRGSGAVRMAVM